MPKISWNDVVGRPALTRRRYPALAPVVTPAPRQALLSCRVAPATVDAQVAFEHDARGAHGRATIQDVRRASRPGQPQPVRPHAVLRLDTSIAVGPGMDDGQHLQLLPQLRELGAQHCDLHVVSCGESPRVTGHGEACYGALWRLVFRCTLPYFAFERRYPAGANAFGGQASIRRAGTSPFRWLRSSLSSLR